MGDPVMMIKNALLVLSKSYVPPIENDLAVVQAALN